MFCVVAVEATTKRFEDKMTMLQEMDRKEGRRLIVAVIDLVLFVHVGKD